MPLKTYLQLTLLVSSLLICSIATLAQGNSNNNKIRVHLSVIGADALKGQITTEMTKQLSEIKDLELAKDQNSCDWRLIVSALEIETKLGKLGIVVSVVAMKQFDNSIFDNLDYVELETIEALKRKTAGLSYYGGNGIEVCSADTLAAACQRIVADFNEKYLNTERRLRQSEQSTTTPAK